MPFKVYTDPETPFLFRPSVVGGAGTDFNVASLAANAGYASAQVDLGSGARSPLYEWRAQFRLVSPVLIGNTLELYVASSDGTTVDGGISSAGGGITADKRRNLQYLGTVTVDAAGSEVTLSASGLVYIYGRYAQLVVFNGTDSAMSATAAALFVWLTGVPDEVQ